MGQVVALEIASRDKILDAAERLFARRGFAGTGMREVAESAGLGKSSLFHHFKSKAELYAAVVTRILALFERRLTAALAAGGDPLARFDRWLDAVIDTIAEEQTSARLLLRSLFEDDDLTGQSEEERAADETLNRLFGAVGKLLQEAARSGLFRNVDIPHTLQSIVGLTVYHFASGDFGAELLGEPVFAPAQVQRRKAEVKALLYHGLIDRKSDTPKR